jgi:hypothetical protein
MQPIMSALLRCCTSAAEFLRPVHQQPACLLCVAWLVYSALAVKATAAAYVLAFGHGGSSITMAGPLPNCCALLCCAVVLCCASRHAPDPREAPQVV